MKNREIVSQEELIKIINSLFKENDFSNDDCRECHVSGIKKLVEPDTDGCNWSRDIFFSGPRECIASIYKIIDSIRKNYNLKD